MTDLDTIFDRDMAVPWFVASAAICVIGSGALVIATVNGFFWHSLPATGLLLGASVAFNSIGWRCLRQRSDPND